MKTVTIYTDGACSGNPGPGGWCAILQYGANEKQLSGGEANTTNNRMAGKGLGTHLAEARLGQIGQKACPEPGPLADASVSVRHA